MRDTFFFFVGGAPLNREELTWLAWPSAGSTSPPAGRQSAGRQSAGRQLAGRQSAGRQSAGRQLASPVDVPTKFRQSVHSLPAS